MKNFAKIYNDVFSFEKPANVQKYFLTEVSVIEFIPPLSSTEDMKQSKRPFGNKIPMQKRCSYNFVRGTSRFVQYSNSRPFMDFLANAVYKVKANDATDPNLDLMTRGARKVNPSG
jgi:hypothetical protein